jgi:hypothetical protein
MRCRICIMDVDSLFRFQEPNGNCIKATTLGSTGTGTNTQAIATLPLNWSSTLQWAGLI